jgi:hypothetical protein
VYPAGNNRQDALALYLAVAEDDQTAFQLNRSAQFKLMLLSEVAGGDVVKETHHVFTHRETDWGAFGCCRMSSGAKLSLVCLALHACCSLRRYECWSRPVPPAPRLHRVYAAG